MKKLGKLLLLACLVALPLQASKKFSKSLSSSSSRKFSSIADDIVKKYKKEIDAALRKQGIKNLKSLPVNGSIAFDYKPGDFLQRKIRITRIEKDLLSFAMPCLQQDEDTHRGDKDIQTRPGDTCGYFAHRNCWAAANYTSKKGINWFVERCFPTSVGRADRARAAMKRNMWRILARRFVGYSLQHKDIDDDERLAQEKKKMRTIHLKGWAGKGNGKERRAVAEKHLQEMEKKMKSLVDLHDIPEQAGIGEDRVRLSQGEIDFYMTDPEGYRSEEGIPLLTARWQESDVEMDWSQTDMISIPAPMWDQIGMKQERDKKSGEVKTFIQTRNFTFDILKRKLGRPIVFMIVDPDFGHWNGVRFEPRSDGSCALIEMESLGAGGGSALYKLIKKACTLPLTSKERQKLENTVDDDEDEDDFPEDGESSALALVYEQSDKDLFFGKPKSGLKKKKKKKKTKKKKKKKKLEPKKHVAKSDEEKGEFPSDDDGDDFSWV